MRVRVDRSRCMGFGLCASYSSMFKLTESELVIEGDSVPTEEESAVRAAESNCPTVALIIAD